MIPDTQACCLSFKAECNCSWAAYSGEYSWPAACIEPMCFAGLSSRMAHMLDDTSALSYKRCALQVGLNNMKNNDYANTVVQILARITPIRDFFLMPSNYADCRSLLVQHFGELLRKVWNPRNFKGQVRASHS